MSSKEIKKHIINKNKEELLSYETNADVGYYAIGMLYERDVSKEFIYELLIELANNNKISPLSFIRIMEYKDIELTDKIYNILIPHNFKKLLFDFCDYTGNHPISSIALINWWHDKGGSFGEFSIGKIAQGVDNITEKILLILNWQPELFNIQLIKDINNEELEANYLILLNFMSKQDAEDLINNKFIKCIDIIKHIEHNWSIVAKDCVKIIKNMAYNNYEEYIKACIYYNVNTDLLIEEILEDFDDRESFDSFVNELIKEKGEEYLKLKLQPVISKIYDGDNCKHLRTINSIFKDEKLALQSAWAEYDLFCQWEGRCTFEKHRASVIEIIEFYKTYVPEFNEYVLSEPFKDEEDLDNFINYYFS
jgi:hypothetical protein